VSDAEAALLGLDGGWRAQGAAGDATTPLVPRWLVRIKDCPNVTDTPGATGYPEWLEAAVKLLQAHTPSCSAAAARPAMRRISITCAKYWATTNRKHDGNPPWRRILGVARLLRARRRDLER